jgi:hypothetical protein
MEANPIAVALISVVGAFIVFLLSLLITMIVQLKKDVDSRDDILNGKIDKIQERLLHVVLIDSYVVDQREVTIQLRDQEKRIIRLEFKIKVDDYEI